MARQDELEARLSEMINRVAHEFADMGDDLRWAMTRGLIHRAVHYAADRPGVEFCALATYMGEQIGHAHRIAHGDNPKAPAHQDLKH